MLNATRGNEEPADSFHLDVAHDSRQILSDVFIWDGAVDNKCGM